MEYKIDKFEITHDYDVQEAIGGSLEYGRFYTDVRIVLVSKDENCYNLMTGKYSIGSILNISYLDHDYEFVINQMNASVSMDKLITIEISGTIRYHEDLTKFKTHYVKVNL